MTHDAEYLRRLSLANARSVAAAAYSIDQAAQADLWRSEAERLRNELAAERAAHAATRAELTAVLGDSKAVAAVLANDARRAWLYGRPR